MSSFWTYIRKQWIEVVVFGSVVAEAVLFISYQHRFGYLLPPGDDAISHIEVARRLFDEPSLLYKAGDEPGLHLFVAYIAHWLRTDVLSVLNGVWLVLMPLSSLSLFYVSKILFNRKTAFIAFILYVVVAGQPWQTLNDGGFPNLLAGNTLLPLAYVCWLAFWKNRTFKSMATLSGILLMIVFTHRLSTIIGVVIISLSLIPLLLVEVSYKRTSAIRSMSFFFILIAAIGTFIILLWYSPLFENGRSLIAQLFSTKDSFPYVAFSNTYPSSSIWTTRDYLQSLQSPIFGGFWLGAISIIIYWKKVPYSLNLASTFCLTWGFAMYAGGHISQLGEPSRLSRDLVIPATILSAVGIIRLFSLAGLRYSITIASVLLISFPFFFVRYQYFTTYNPMIRFSKADEEMIGVIREQYPEKVLWLGPGNHAWTRIFQDSTEKWNLVNPIEVVDAKERFKVGELLLISQFDDRVWLPGKEGNQELLNQSIGLELLATNSDQNKTNQLYLIK